MSDEEAIIYLSQLRQIGRWSAEMILLFTYNRSNIWPIQDIGLLRGISNNYKKKYLPPKSYVNSIADKRFSPYCSVATWYLVEKYRPRSLFSTKTFHNLEVSFCSTLLLEPILLGILLSHDTQWLFHSLEIPK